MLGRIIIAFLVATWPLSAGSQPNQQQLNQTLDPSIVSALTYTAQTALKVCDKANEQTRAISRGLIGQGLKISMHVNHTRLTFGKMATYYITITNSTNYPVTIESTEVQFPEELKVMPHGGIFWSDNNAGGNGHILDPGAEFRRTVVFDPCGSSSCIVKTFLSSLSFIPGPAYNITVQVHARPQSAKEPQDAVIASARFPIAVDMPMFVVALVASAGAMIAALCHLGTEVLMVRRTSDDSLDPRNFIRKNVLNRTHDSLILMPTGMAIAFVTAPLLSLTSNASSVLSIKIMDSFGALAIGFLIYFVTYEVGYLRIYRLVGNALAK